MRGECTKSKTGIRFVKQVEFEAERNAITAKMKTPQAKETYRFRRQTVEPAIGDIKENKGVRSFLTRGINSVRAEFNIVCTAANIKRIWLAAKLKNKPIRTLATAFGT